MRMTIGLIVGLAIGLTATAYARNPPTKWKELAWCARAGTYESCSIPAPRAGGYVDISVASLDLDCTLQSANQAVGISEFFLCDRASRDPGGNPGDGCFDGVIGSASADITSTEMNVTRPIGCVVTNVTKAHPLGYYANSWPAPLSIRRSP